MTAPTSKRTVKPIAFYLPQYHPIPENDAWWGKGFTEWNNVTRARPLFRHHQQPRVPERLGYYDLRNPETQEAQARLARAFGVHGFCYYYYWFNGRKLLNRPIDQMLASGSPDFPFCICWANENWSRNWDGQHRHILMQQDYSPEGTLAFIQDIIPMMQDSRYIRHEGKPVLVVYRISNIPDWRRVADRWRNECRKAGLGEIHLCAVRFGLEPLQGQPYEHGLDSYILFPPHEAARADLRDEVADLHPEFGGELFSYDAVVEGDLDRFEDGYPWPVHRGAMMAWDNTARRHFASRIFQGATPPKFRGWLRNILRQEDAHNPSSESLLFINAWNEWAEGTYLEPDQQFGTAYLEAVQSALQGYNVPEFETPLATGAPRTPVKGSQVSRLRAARMFDQNFQRQWLPGNVQTDPDKPTLLLCAHISGHQLYGGERSFLDVIRALDGLGYNLVVTLPSGNNPDYIADIRQHVVGIYVMPYPQWRDDREPIERLTLCFKQIILNHGISVVHANTITLLEPLEAARRLGVKAVIHARELVMMDEGLCAQIGQSPLQIIANVLKRSDAIIANSSATAQTFAKPRKTFLAYNAVSTGAFTTAGRPDTPMRFGIVSSNLPKKGVADFVETVRRHGHKLANVEFVVVGPERPETKVWVKEIAAGDLPANLKFVGYRESPQLAMDELDVLVSLSEFAESFGRTIAEAAAAGKPTIAYHWGAVPEVIKDGKTGVLVGYRDIDALADAMKTLSASPERVAEMGQAARSFIETRFSQEVLQNSLRKAYKKILAGTKPTASAQLTLPTIIVPIYNAAEAFSDCLSSLLEHTPHGTYRAIFINDASTDPRIAELLEGVADQDHITVVTNPENLGYTRSINLAIRMVEGSDIVLLNSDARVTANWLDGLQLAARESEKVGTVTAMSDNAGAFSFPKQGIANPCPAWMQPDEFAATLLQATGGLQPVSVPTGSGFCMYIRAGLMNEIGLFDEDAFPRGYGEENDFCMRAEAAGWSNLITPWSYVFHVRTASFGHEKETLIKAGVDEVIRRHPTYTARVKEAFGSDEMAALREAAGACYR
jgi:glycosyltransferase involved in cell wall biosynthesis/GT2 family glycosyltransferase